MTQRSDAFVKLPSCFVGQFLRVAEHYRCSPAEVEEMKAAVRRDSDNAQECFAELAKEIAREQAAVPMTCGEFWKWRNE